MMLKSRTSFQTKNNKVTANLIWNLPHKLFMSKQQTARVEDPGVRAALASSGMTLCDERQTTRGFTLIELLVVVLIIGILAAVALPQYQKAVTKSHLANLKILVEKIADAADLYYLTNNVYPSEFDQLDIDIPAPTSTEKIGSKFYAYYPWGNCAINKEEGQSFVYCEHDKGHIGYARYSPTTTAYNVYRACTAPGHNAISIEVCKQETEQPSHYYSDSNIISFAYNK